MGSGLARLPQAAGPPASAPPLSPGVGMLPRKVGWRQLRQPGGLYRHRIPRVLLAGAHLRGWVGGGGGQRSKPEHEAQACADTLHVHPGPLQRAAAGRTRAATPLRSASAAAHKPAVAAALMWLQCCSPGCNLASPGARPPHQFIEHDALGLLAAQHGGGVDGHRLPRGNHLVAACGRLGVVGAGRGGGGSWWQERGNMQHGALLQLLQTSAAAGRSGPAQHYPPSIWRRAAWGNRPATRARRSGRLSSPHDWRGMPSASRCSFSCGQGCKCRFSSKVETGGCNGPAA